MSKILIIAEHDGQTLNPSTAKTVACAAEIDGATIDVVVLAESPSDVAEQAAKLDTVARYSNAKINSGKLQRLR